MPALNHVRCSMQKVQAFIFEIGQHRNCLEAFGKKGALLLELSRYVSILSKSAAATLLKRYARPVINLPLDERPFHNDMSHGLAHCKITRKPGINRIIFGHCLI